MEEDGLAGSGTKFGENGYHNKSNMRLHSDSRNAGVSNHNVVFNTTVDHERFYDNSDNNSNENENENENGKRGREEGSVSGNVGEYIYDNNENNDHNNYDNNNNYNHKNENFDPYENNIPPFRYQSSSTVLSNSITNNGNSTFTKIGFFTESNIFDFHIKKEGKISEIFQNNRKFYGNFVQFENIEYVELMSDSSYLNLVLVLSDRLCVMPCDLRLWICNGINDKTDKYNNRNNYYYSYYNVYHHYHHLNYHYYYYYYYIYQFYH